MCVNSLPKTVTSGCDLNPGPSAPESSTLTTRLPSHPLRRWRTKRRTAAKTTRSSATADGPRDALPVEIVSTVESSCTTNRRTDRSKPRILYTCDHDPVDGIHPFQREWRQPREEREITLSIVTPPHVGVRQRSLVRDVQQHRQPYAQPKRSSSSRHVATCTKRCGLLLPL